METCQISLSAGLAVAQRARNLTLARGQRLVRHAADRLALLDGRRRHELDMRLRNHMAPEGLDADRHPVAASERCAGAVHAMLFAEQPREILDASDPPLEFAQVLGVEDHRTAMVEVPGVRPGRADRPPRLEEQFRHAGVDERRDLVDDARDARRSRRRSRSTVPGAKPRARRSVVCRAHAW
jgi:hypothetical protein